VLDQVPGELEDVGSPVALLAREPLLEHARKGGQVQHEVFGVDELWCFTVDTRTWGEQIDRVELVATVVALVAAGSVVTADGAGALDVAVGKCTPGGGRHGPLGGVGEDVTVLVQRDEQLL